MIYARYSVCGVLQQTPGFRSRKSGIIVNRDAAEPMAGSRFDVCCPFEELLALFAAEVAVTPFVARVSHVSAKNREVFPRNGHRSRFGCLWNGRKMKTDRNENCAAIYLLSADRFLWGKAVAAIQEDTIQFQKIQIGGADLQVYVLFHAAKDLYQGTNHIKLSELLNPKLIDDDLFYLLLIAFLIRRYGEGVLSVERRQQC